MTVLRFFASTRAVVGEQQVPIHEFSLPAVVNTNLLRETLVARYPEARNLFLTCTFLADGARIGERMIEVKDFDTIDVLPPFAGG